MNLKTKVFAASVLCAATTGCVTTQEMPISPNEVRLDTRASGLLSVGQAVPQTMRKAAQLTLDGGFTHFRLQQVDSKQGDRLAGTYSTASGSAFATGNGNSAIVSGSASGLSTPIYRKTSDVGATVIMYHADEPGAKDAFDAAEVLKKYSQ